jgi:hypothetical protein
MDYAKASGTMIRKVKCRKKVGLLANPAAISSKER